MEDKQEETAIAVLPETGSTPSEPAAGTAWSSSARIIISTIGYRVTSLPWAVAQLGWGAGYFFLVLFSALTCYTSSFLGACYPSGDSVTAVETNLGGMQVTICAWIQIILIPFGEAIGQTIAATSSMMAIHRLDLFNRVSYTIVFGIIEIILSPIQDFDQICWVSVVSTLMSVVYITIGFGLMIVKVAGKGKFGGSLNGVMSIANVTQAEKIWRSFRAIGDIAFACPFAMALLQIDHGAIRYPPLESQQMQKPTLKATLICACAGVTTLFYILYAIVGYAALGDSAPKNILAGFGFSNIYFLFDIANVAFVVYLLRAYQVNFQRGFEFIQKKAAERFPGCGFITVEIKISIRGCSFPLKVFRLVYGVAFVSITTVISILFPFEDVSRLLGALGFCLLSVNCKMYIKRIPKWSTKWVIVTVAWLAIAAIAIVAAIGSMAGFIHAFKGYKPFGWDD